MKALQDFLTTDYGLMSLVVIAVAIYMMVFIFRFAMRHIREDTERARLEQSRKTTSTP
ncbi:DUF3149 domain-containing protein [Ampullimonas aquatilis]|uniref:DUF3149 domain-containing protein n=1 Tax=Ampullimonas aquatilis TaxID=1341549 RepID=UPI003C7494BB